MNTNILGEISRAIVNADSFVQGLKRHWLLRSAFRTKDTNAPPAAPQRRSAPRKTKTNGSSGISKNTLSDFARGGYSLGEMPASI